MQDPHLPQAVVNPALGNAQPHPSRGHHSQRIQPTTKRLERPGPHRRVTLVPTVSGKPGKKPLRSQRRSL